MPFVQTLRCSCEKIKGQVEKWHLAVGPLAWAMPAEVVCMVRWCSLSTCCCCKTAVLWPLACSIRKAFDQVNTSYFDFPKNKQYFPGDFFGLAAISKK